MYNRLKSALSLLQLYLTGAVYSLDGADCLKDTMQTCVEIDNKVRVKYTYIYITVQMFVVSKTFLIRKDALN